MLGAHGALGIKITENSSFVVIAFKDSINDSNHPFFYSDTFFQPLAARADKKGIELTFQYAELSSDALALLRSQVWKTLQTENTEGGLPSVSNMSTLVSSLSEKLELAKKLKKLRILRSERVIVASDSSLAKKISQNVNIPNRNLSEHGVASTK